MALRSACRESGPDSLYMGSDPDSPRSIFRPPGSNPDSPRSISFRIESGFTQIHFLQDRIRINQDPFPSGSNPDSPRSISFRMESGFTQIHFLQDGIRVHPDPFPSGWNPVTVRDLPLALQSALMPQGDCEHGFSTQFTNGSP